MNSRIFLVGAPRSGTTLLQQIIISNFNDIQTFPETHFFSIAHPINKVKKSIGWKNLYLQGYTKKLSDKLNIVYSKKYKTPIFGKEYFVGFIKLLDDITKNNNKNNWLEKTPRHLHFIEDIKNVENSKFIHIVRKGEEVVASLFNATNNYPKAWVNKKYTKFKGYSLDECILRWNRDLDITYTYRNNDKHLIIFYEDILSNRSKVLGQLTSFLNLDIKDEVLSLSDIASNIIEKREEWKENNKKEKIMNRNSFKSLFSEKEQNYILEYLDREKYDVLYREQK